MSFVNRLIWIFISPSRVFADIRSGSVSWWQPWLWLSILATVAAYIAQPAQRAVTALNLRDLPPEQVEQQLEMMDRFGWLFPLPTPFLVLLFGAALSGLTYVLVTIISSNAKFKQYFTIVLYGGVIGVVSTLLSSILVHLRGVENIRTAMDAQISLGLGFLAPEGNSLLFAVLSTVEVFTIWSLVVIGLGLMRVFDMTRNQAIACVIPWWVIGAILALMGAAFGGMG